MKTRGEQIADLERSIERMEARSTELRNTLDTAQRETRRLCDIAASVKDGSYEW